MTHHHTDAEPGHPESERLTLPEPWESMTAGRGDDEELTIEVDGESQPFFSRRQLAERFFADPEYQARMARVHDIVKTHHEEKVPGLGKVLVPNGQTAEEAFGHKAADSDSAT